MKRIYLDHAATTPVLPEVRETMITFLTDIFGNPSSLHEPGRNAKNAVEDSRENIAEFLGAKPREIIFTGGGSESNNMAIKGTARALEGKGNHIITSRIEHHSVIEPCRFLESLGYDVTYLPVDSHGIVDPGDVEREITSRTIMISIMHANNEIGTIEPVADIARIAHEHGILMHTDAVQTFGHIKFGINDLGVDMMSVSAHKLYGPKGVGFLYMREGTTIVPLIHGGGQETHRRAGTHNVAGIAGLGKAVEYARPAVNNEQSILGSMYGRLRTALLSEIDGIKINGHESRRLPGILSVTIPGVDGDTLVLGLDRKGISCSSGAACMSVNFETSHVLAAIGMSRAESKSTIRISLGRCTTTADIDHASKAIGELTRSLRTTAQP